MKYSWIEEYCLSKKGVIKDFKVKGSSNTVKRGTVIKGIHLTSNDEEIECKVAGMRGLVLKTCFLKKA